MKTTQENFNQFHQIQSLQQATFIRKIKAFELNVFNNIIQIYKLYTNRSSKFVIATSSGILIVEEQGSKARLF